jgi:hypothetical protein
MTEQQTTLRLAAILAADVAGCSSMMGTDEAGMLGSTAADWSQTSRPGPNSYMLSAMHRWFHGAVLPIC